MSAPTADSLVFTCKNVEAGAPVLDVFREDDGWSVLCGGDHTSGDDGPVLIHLAHLAKDDPTLLALPALSVGDSASRDAGSGSWQIYFGHEHGEDAESERERRLVSDIAAYGFHILSVTGGDEPEFSYTVGLKRTYDHPELIAFGQKSSWRAALFHAIVENIRDDGTAFADGSELTDVIPPYALVFKRIRERSTRREYLGYAAWYYTGDDFDALQVIWPDKAHRMPWQTGYENPYPQPLVF